MTHPSFPEIPGYTLKSALGHGGMGIVYRAHQRNLNRIVALKVLHFRPDSNLDESKQLYRFVREIKIQSRVSHPNILPVLDVGTYEGLVYLTTPLIEGGSLRGRIDREPLCLDVGRFIFGGISSGLQFLHEKGILHRDLKPDNVLLDQNDSPLIADFGLSREQESTNLTGPGHVLGTLRYLAPEVLSGDRQSEKSDIYALGFMLYEALAGCPPFQGDSPKNWAYLILSKDPMPLGRVVTDLPTPIEFLVMNMIARDPESRPSLDEVIGKLAGSPNDNTSNGSGVLGPAPGSLSHVATQSPVSLPQAPVDTGDSHPGRGPDQVDSLPCDSPPKRASKSASKSTSRGGSKSEPKNAPEIDVRVQRNSWFSVLILLIFGVGVWFWGPVHSSPRGLDRSGPTTHVTSFGEALSSPRSPVDSASPGATTTRPVEPLTRMPAGWIQDSIEAGVVDIQLKSGLYREILEIRGQISLRGPSAGSPAVIELSRFPGIRVFKNSQLEVSNITIKGVRSDDQTVSLIHAVDATLSMKNCRVDCQSMPGILVTGPQATLDLDEILLTNASRFGFALQNGVSTHILNTTLADTDGIGIRSWKAGETLLESSRILRCSDEAIRLESSTMRVSATHIMDNGPTQITGVLSSFLDFEQGSIVTSTGRGVKLSKGSSARFHGTEIRTEATAIDLQDNGRLEVEGGEFTGVGSAILAQSGSCHVELNHIRINAPLPVEPVASVEPAPAVREPGWMIEILEGTTGSMNDVTVLNSPKGGIYLHDTDIRIVGLVIKNSKTEAIHIDGGAPYIENFELQSGRSGLILGSGSKARVIRGRLVGFSQGGMKVDSESSPLIQGMWSFRNDTHLSVRGKGEPTVDDFRMFEGRRGLSVSQAGGSYSNLVIGGLEVGMILEECLRVSVRDSRILESLQEGIHAVRGSRADFDRVGCNFAAGFGIALEDSRVTFRDGWVESNASWGLQVTGNGNVELERSRIRGNGAHGLMVASDSSCTAGDCWVESNGGMGIFASQSARVGVRGGTVRNNLKQGILVGNEASLDLKETTVAGNAMNGVVFEGRGTGTLENLMAIQNEGRGLYSKSQSTIDFVSGTIGMNSRGGVAAVAGRMRIGSIVVAASSNQELEFPSTATMEELPGLHLRRVPKEDIQIPSLKPPAPPENPRRALTWVCLRQDESRSRVLIGAYESDPFTGDTLLEQTLPVLAVFPLERSGPGVGLSDGVWVSSPGAPPGWCSGEIRLTPPVRGSLLTSIEVADAWCRNSLGEPCRMARTDEALHTEQFPEARSGSVPEVGKKPPDGCAFWARGDIRPGSRFWIAGTRGLNPWDSRLR